MKSRYKTATDLGIHDYKNAYKCKYVCECIYFIIKNSHVSKKMLVNIQHILSFECNLLCLVLPLGDAETSVTNLFCIVYTASYNTASLHCNWFAGKQAPTDTVYLLFYR